MRTLDIPLNKHFGIYKIPESGEFILGMKADEKLKNHLGTLHATALFGLAEATSGEFLLNEFSEYESEIIPLVRKAEIKFSKPVSGEVKSKAGFFESDKAETLNSLEKSNSVSIKVKVDIYDEESQKVFNSIFDWFFVRRNRV